MSSSFQQKSQTTALTIGAIGVVFGDIGTSPLYAFREALNQSGASDIDASEIIGVLSLALWALILVVTLKYVLFLMRADNHGEGGVLSLMALAKRAVGGSTLIFVLGAAGAALFYGDAVITPALSVLSAVEGLRTVPGLEQLFSDHAILAITIAILVGLFALQAHGTSRVARLFGPVCLVWFITIGGLGLFHIADAPQILIAFNPALAVGYLAGHGVTGLYVLGAVFLTVTGAEALTADMGHFGRGPIRIGWFALVFPALTLNYLGQGSFALAAFESAHAQGKLLANADWFFLMAPDAWRGSLVILATLATIIASQAVITGAYSLTQQAIALGLLPRMTIAQTSENQAGQIYIPVINWLLLAGVILLVVKFGSSSAMAAAYGIAVTGTMVITTCLAFFVVRHLWHWSLAATTAVILPFLSLDLFFFATNALRVVEGGWVPLVIAALIGAIIYSWVRGRGLLAARLRDDSIAMVDLAKSLAARPPERVAGMAVFLTSDPQAAPVALLHNLKHNRVLHTTNVIINVKTANSPRIEASARLALTPHDANFSFATLTYGYMESPDIPADLFGDGQLVVPRGGTSYFIGRNSVGAARQAGGMPYWQDVIFIFLQRNASDPTAFFQIPPARVVELGTRIEV